MSGFEICKQIKSNPKTKHIPVFLFGNEELIKLRIERTKADGYIFYPFKFSDLDVILNILKITK